jgi:Outer membrane protein beta-barrel domain
MCKVLIRYFVILCSFFSLSVFAEIKGKVDVGATLFDIDLLKSGKTEKTLHMVGVKGDATIMVYEGLCLKPTVLWGKGDGELIAGSLAVGYYLPVCKDLRLIPNVGCSWSYLHTWINLEQIGLMHQKERFRSDSPFIGMDICYSLTSKLTLMAMYQYGWARTHTQIGSVVTEKSHSCGPNYSLGFDYSMNQQWSIVGGIGYNLTLSKEKHGLRGKGAKLGLAYYF